MQRRVEPMLDRLVRPHLLPRRSVRLFAGVPAALIALIVVPPISHTVRAQSTSAEQQGQATINTTTVKPVERTRTAGAREVHSAIQFAALGAEDSPEVATLTEEEGLVALEQDLSLKVGKHLQVVDYPEEALRWRWTGTVLVEVVIAANGLLKDVALSRTSGFRVLDQQALAVVRRVSKVYMPAGLRARDRTLTVPVGFYLQNL